MAPPGPAHSSASQPSTARAAAPGRPNGGCKVNRTVPGPAGPARPRSGGLAGRCKTVSRKICKRCGASLGGVVGAKDPAEPGGAGRPRSPRGGPGRPGRAEVEDPVRSAELETAKLARMLSRARMAHIPRVRAVKSDSLSKPRSSRHVASSCLNRKRDRTLSHAGIGPRAAGRPRCTGSSGDVLGPDLAQAARPRPAKPAMGPAAPRGAPPTRMAGQAAWLAGRWAQRGQAGPALPVQPVQPATALPQPLDRRPVCRRAARAKTALEQEAEMHSTGCQPAWL